MILRRHAGPWRVEEVRRFLHRRWQASVPLAHMPANQPARPTTPRHIYYGHHARKRTPRHSAVAAATTTTAPSTRSLVHARIRVARSRVVVKVSHLLAACGPLHSPVHASRLSSFKVYYVFAKNIGGPVARCYRRCRRHHMAL